jgi:hypothetical protein
MYINAYVCVHSPKRVIAVVAVGWSRRVVERRQSIEMNSVRHRPRL